jgi:hypothetical protein
MVFGDEITSRIAIEGAVAELISGKDKHGVIYPFTASLEDDEARL